MKPASEHKNWLSLLLRWLEGDANHKDERELDTLSTKDPFLADAMEGYRSMPAENHIATTTRLKGNLRNKYQKKRPKAAFYLLRVAAVGAVLVSAWLIINELGKEESSQPAIATTTENAAPAEPAASIAPAEPQPLSEGDDRAASVQSMDRQAESLQNGAPGSTAPESPLADIAAEKAAPPPVLLPESAAAERSFELAQAAREEERVADEAKIAAAEAKNEESVAPAAPPAAARQRFEESPKHDAMGKVAMAPNHVAGVRRISGTVSDETGEPLIGASVLVDSFNFGTNTNVDGRYSIEVPENAESLLFSYIGYGNMHVEIGAADSIDVEMATNAGALEEVAVTGVRKGKSKQAKSPEPKGGFKKFEKYLTENLRYPEDAMAAGVNGKVVVGFTIGDDGSLSDFRITQSLGEGFDAEAIRLLREGPKWKAQPGTYAVYAIPFNKD